MKERGPLDQMQIIDVDAQPWVDVVDETGFIPEGAATKTLVDPDSGNTFLLTRFAPNAEFPGHWHPSDTIYIITQGEFSVEGEGTYVPGDIRWVRGGTSYGSESAGPDGCEFYILSVGPFAVHDPTVDPPPNGTWRDVLGG